MRPRRRVTDRGPAAGPGRGRQGRVVRVPPGIAAGVLATMTMDAALLAASALGGPVFTADRLSVQMIGRWAAGLARGRWRHEDITRAPAQRGELAIGLATHYATGILLTAVFLPFAPHGRRGRTIVSATAYGLSTAVLPLLVMFPSMGYGRCGNRSGEAVRLNRIMLLGHAAFGAGIGLWAPIARGRRTRP